MTTVAEATDLRIGLADVARLARVRRPVVSMWRKRFSTRPSAFPAALETRGGVELFDAVSVARWLVDTEHGNNPDAVTEVPLHARPQGFEGSYVDVMTSLLALRAAHGFELGALARDDLMDLADETDPDDEALFRELDRVESGLERMARHADQLVEAAYGVAPAFEHTLVAHRRSSRDDGRSELAAEAASLCAEIAIELALTNPLADAAAPRFADPTGASADRLIDVVDRLTDVAEPVVMSADGDTSAARLLRRRLLAHGVPRTGLAVDAAGDFQVSGPVVNVAQYPSPDGGALDALATLSGIDQIALQMDDAQRAVVVAPSSVLVDGGLQPQAAALRSRVLRTDRVRAIVRLPAGLLPSAPRQHMAIWVLGPAHEGIAIADRWTMLSDLSTFELTPVVRADLVGDLAAAMGDRQAVHAHSFTFTRVTPTSRVLARSGSLLDVGGTLRHAPEQAKVDAETSARFDQIVDDLGADSVPASVRAAVPSAFPARVPPATFADLVREGHVRYVPGSRLDVGDLATDDRSGFTVIGPDEVRGDRTPGDRRIDRLRLAAAYPSARLTEPGDVVFLTGAEPAAWVDHDGSSVVMAPARVLRINRDDDAGLLPDVLAMDVARSAPATRWHSWRVRRVATDQRAPLARTLADLRSARIEALQRIAKLEELEHLIVAGTAAGTLTLTEPPVE